MQICVQKNGGDTHNKEFFLTEIAARDEKIVQLDQKITHQDQQIQYLEEQLAWFKRQIFGKRSERVVSDLNGQQLFFDGFEAPSQKEEEKKLVTAHEWKKPNRNGQDKITLQMICQLKRQCLIFQMSRKCARKLALLLFRSESKLHTN